MFKRPVFCAIVKQISNDHQYTDEPFAAFADSKLIIEKAWKLDCCCHTGTAAQHGSQLGSALTNAPFLNVSTFMD